MSRYNTRSNKVRVVKTPGGALRYLHIKKAGTAPKCGDCGIKLPGVSGLYPIVGAAWRGIQSVPEVEWTGP
jgi:ribosomal protein L34E